MVAITKSLLAVAVAFTSLASCLDHANLSGRNDTIEAVADPVKVDSGGSYMRTARLKNGDILAAYSTSDGNDTTIRTVLSSNGGDSWEKLGEVVRGPSSTRDIGNAYPLELPNGRIVLAFRNHDKEEDTNYGFTWFRITLCESKDGGKTWEYVSQIADRQARDRFTGLWEPFLRIGEDGYLQAYISYENSSGDQDNIMRKSTDGGKTWSDPRNVSGDGVDARDGMVGIADTGNGTLMCVFESTEIGRMSVHYVLSDDDGKTWDNRTLLYEAEDNNLAGAPQIINVGGTLVVSFMSTERRPSTGVDGGEQKIITSSDNGTSWSEPQVLSGLDSHWPGLLVSTDEQFLSLYSRDGKGILSDRQRVLDERHRVVEDVQESGASGRSMGL